MKKLLISLVAVALLSVSAAATTSSTVGQSGTETTTNRNAETVIVELEQTPSTDQSESELYYDHVELEAPIIDIQVEAEIDSL